MQDERFTYWNKGISVKSQNLVHNVTSHIVECGLAVPAQAKVNYLPGLLVTTYGRCYIDVFVLYLLLYLFIYRNGYIADKKLL